MYITKKNTGQYLLTINIVELELELLNLNSMKSLQYYPLIVAEWKGFLNIEFKKILFFSSFEILNYFCSA